MTNKPRKSFIYLIFGKRGSGKTVLAKSLLNTWGLNHDFVVWDYLGEYKHAVIIEDIDVFGDYIKDRVRHPEKKTQVILRLPEPDFDEVCRIVRIKAKLLLLIEEVDGVSSPTQIMENFKRLIRYGRHADVSMIATSRRPASVPRLLTSQADRMFLFRFREPRDVQYLREYSNINPEHLKNLEQYKYLDKWV